MRSSDLTKPARKQRRRLAADQRIDYVEISILAYGEEGHREATKPAAASDVPSEWILLLEYSSIYSSERFAMQKNKIKGLFHSTR